MNTFSVQEYNNYAKKHVDVQYLKIAKRILEHGNFKKDRTGTGTLSIFAPQIRIDLQLGFPILTTKKVNIDAVIHELLWFLDGDTNIKTLINNNVNIWNADAYRMYLREFDDNSKALSQKDFIQLIKDDANFAAVYGDLGRVYGAQWRSWSAFDEFEEVTIDQISNVIEGIKNDPDSRRHIVSAWNVGELDQMALPPCHMAFQFYVADGKLSCKLEQRSADWFLGVPFNIASYALLTHMVAHVTGYEVGELVINFGDAHIYANHIEQIKTQLERMPRELPTLYLNNDITDIFDFEFDDIVIDGYNSHEAIKGQVSVGV